MGEKTKGKGLADTKSFLERRALLSSGNTSGKGLADTKSFLERRAVLSGLTSADASSALANQKLKPASKISDVLTKAAKKTVIGKVLVTAVKVGAGVGAGYEYAKSKFKDKEEKVDKKATGGMADYIKDLL